MRKNSAQLFFTFCGPIGQTCRVGNTPSTGLTPPRGVARSNTTAAGRGSDATDVVQHGADRQEVAAGRDRPRLRSADAAGVKRRSGSVSRRTTDGGGSDVICQAYNLVAYDGEVARHGAGHLADRAPANAREHVAFQTCQPVLGVLLVAPRGPLLFKHPCGGVLAGAFPRPVQPDTRRDTRSPTRSSCPRVSTPRAPKRVRRQAGAPASPCRSLGRDPR